MKFTNDYNSNDMIDILNIFNMDERYMTDMINISYNTMLGRDIIIPSNDDGIAIIHLLKDINDKIINCNTINTNLINKRNQLNNKGKSTVEVDNNIVTNNRLLTELTNKYRD